MRILLVAGLLLHVQGVATLAGQQSPPAAADTSSPLKQLLKQPITGRAISCDSGRIKVFECQNVELLSYLPRNVLGGEGGYADIWGWIDSATGREFAIVGGITGTAFVEVSDPVNPKYLGRLPLYENAKSGIPGIKVYKNYAFIVAEAVSNHGMQVFDLTQLRDVKNAPVTFTATARYDGFGSAHTLTLNEQTGFAYPAGVLAGGTCGLGLHIVDVREPTKPVAAGCYTDMNTGGPIPGYIHDAQCVVYRGPDQQYRGREICLNSSGGGLGIVDVTDKQAPQAITIARYPNVGFTHQGWFTEDQRYFFLDDEHDDGAGGIAKVRTIVFDMNDLDDPVVLTEFYGTTDATDHNLYIRGKYMYQSNYTSGLRIVDISDPKQPKEVGFFDTYPDKSGPGMFGEWGNYPFFKNDVVAVNSAHGLFLIRLRSR